jgi:hypothetical protein
MTIGGHRQVVASSGRFSLTGPSELDCAFSTLIVVI